MRSWWKVSLLALTFAIGAASAGETAKPAIRVRIMLPNSQVDHAKKLNAKLKAMAVQVDELGFSPTLQVGRAQVTYDSQVSAKRIGELVEVLVELGIIQVNLEQSIRPPQALLSKDKPTVVGDGRMVRLVEIGKDKKQWYAVLKNFETNTQWRASGDEDFTLDAKVNAKVVHIGDREMVILLASRYYSVGLGQTIAGAMEEPLNNERRQELKLPAQP